MRHIAVVGCGQWGQHLARNFAELGVLRTACDVDSARLSPIRERFPDVRVTASLGEVLEDNGITGVAVATPASSHYSLAKDMLLAGKDVFVEKPLALRLSEGRELVELADGRGRILMVGHLLRYHPAIRKLKALVDGGKLGRILYIYSNRLNLGRFRTEENILWSFAPHDISVILYLLGEMPSSVAAQGGTYLSRGVPDVTVTTMEFRSGVRGHVFVSWLHPYKEQKLIVVGDRGMAAFNDLESDKKLLFMNHMVEWVGRNPVARMEKAEHVAFSEEEPLRAECRHFVECLETRRRPETDGQEALRVLQILEACQESLDRNAAIVSLSEAPREPYFAHESAIIDESCEIGRGTRIWQFSHVRRHSKIGDDCRIGQNVVVGPNVTIGNGVKIQNNVSVYEGVTLEDNVFCGPSMVFTNVTNPRSEIPRMSELKPTLVKQGTTLGANCTVLCGLTIGRYAFVGAGAVVTKDVTDYALIIGNPGRRVGWMCRCGLKLSFAPGNPSGTERARCHGCGTRYVKQGETVVEE